MNCRKYNQAVQTSDICAKTHFSLFINFIQLFLWSWLAYLLTKANFYNKPPLSWYSFYLPRDDFRMFLAWSYTLHFNQGPPAMLLGVIDFQVGVRKEQGFWKGLVFYQYYVFLV